MRDRCYLMAIANFYNCKELSCCVTNTHDH